MSRKVKFCRSVTVHEIELVDIEIPSWEQAARDRARFLKRIKETEELISPILKHSHRLKIMASRNPIKIIDMQGFTLLSGFRVKELAISDGYSISHFLFQADVAHEKLNKRERRQIAWEQNNLHHLNYDYGYVAYNRLREILLEHTCEAEVIFVKGSQKETVLRDLLPETKTVIINLQDNLNCPLLSTSQNSCVYHNNSFSNCAIENVKLISKFLKLGLNKLN